MKHFSNVKQFVFLLSLITTLSACGDPTSSSSPSPETSTPGTSDSSNPTDDGGTGGKVDDNQGDGNGADAEPSPDCTLETWSRSELSGRLWVDSNREGISAEELGVSDPNDASLAGVSDSKVIVALPGGKKLEAKSCPDGRFHMKNDELGDEKIAVFGFDKHNCTTSNCPSKLAELAGKRTIKVVTFGDSIPSYPEKAHWFPEFLVDVAKPVADIDNVNVAIPGTKTYDWLPTTENFQRFILPNADADIFIFSLGGNNVLMDLYPQMLFGVYGAVKNLIETKGEEKIEEAIKEGKEIIDEIKKISPNAEILWVSYMDYSNSFRTLNAMTRRKRKIVEEFIQDALVRQRDEIAGYKGTLSVDMFGLSHKPHPDGTPFNNEDYLILDGIHLNRRGHFFYAAQVFKALGGAFIGEKIVGDEDKEENQNTFVNFGTRRYVGYPAQ